MNNSCKASDVTNEVMQNVESIVKKIQGRRVSAKLTEEEKKELAASGVERIQVSASQMSFYSRLSDFTCP